MITTTLLTLIAFATGPIAEAPFQDLTYDQALAAAKKDQKIVMIDFFTTWCVPCKKLDKITWKDAAVQAWIGKTAIALKLDAEKEKELAQRFKIEVYPTILFVKADGTEIDRLLGFKEPADFVHEAEGALAGKDAIERVKEKMNGQASGPMERQKIAKVLARQGKYEEALGEYLWCFDHGLEVMNAYTGVRLSFLLNEIVELGQKYPPAIQALEERRDALEKVLDSGTGRFADAADFAGLNQYLRSPERTLALYDRLEKADKLTPELKRALFRHITDSLLAARRYADLVEGAGDIERTVTRDIAQYEKVKGNSGDTDGDTPGDTDYGRQMLVDRVGKYYEALLGAQQQKSADAIADRLITFEASARTFVALIEHAVRAGADDTARALVERALKTLPEKDQERVKLAARKIPEKK
jgi:thiol-disulfide isomerase/thioredoxin